MIENFSNITFHENPSSEGRVVVYGEANMTKPCLPRTLIESDGTICCLYTTISSWRWVLDARNM